MTSLFRRITLMALVATYMSSSIGAAAKSLQDAAKVSLPEQATSCGLLGGASVPGTDTLLDRILASDYAAIDPQLPSCFQSLRDRGAHRCWHKHSTFFDHLVGVHNLLRLWGQGETIGRVGLFHSAYSNSYVNLALFDPDTERDLVRSLIGTEAEKLVFLFCIIDRQEVVVNTLLKQGYIPPEGLHSPHIRDPSQSIYLSPETLRLLTVFSMADTADQYFGWQDELWGGGGHDGSMIIPGKDFSERHNANALWPGLSKPGLWMHYVSSLGKVAETFQSSATESGDVANIRSQDGRARDIPPVFANCSNFVAIDDERQARDLYWMVVSGQAEDRSDEAIIAALQRCIHINPWIHEPLVILAQKYLQRGDFASAHDATSAALDLQTMWGTAWDKRMNFDAWVAWTRVLQQRAAAREPWPTNSWQVNNLGLVK